MPACLRRIGLIAFLLIAAAFLSACGFTAEADLREVARPAFPFKEGVYKVADDDEPHTLRRLGDAYEWSGMNSSPSPLLTVLGPIAGVYVAQYEGSENVFGYLLVRPGEDGIINLADDSMFRAMGELLFDRMDIVKPAPTPIGKLTESAPLNWALLQHLLGDQGSITFRRYATLVSEQLPEGEAELE